MDFTYRSSPEDIRELWKIFKIDYRTTTTFKKQLETIKTTGQPFPEDEWIIGDMLHDKIIEKKMTGTL